MRGGRRAGVAALVGALVVAGCHRRPVVARLPPLPAHYGLGAPWQGDRGVWFYPAESFSGEVTGLAAVEGAHGAQTEDGERYDPRMAAAASQVLQLPAVVRVTNLENGRQMLLRVNDRGPADPGRVISLTPRAAVLLGIEGGVARVRVAVEEGLSRRLAEQLNGGPRLAIETAPRESVQAEALGAPGEAPRAGGAVTIGGGGAAAKAAAVPDRLGEEVVDVGADPGELWLRTDSFGRAEYARRLAGRLAGLPVEVVRTREGRSESYAVQAGPFGSVAGADDALDQALRAGVGDARIVVR